MPLLKSYLASYHMKSVLLAFIPSCSSGMPFMTRSVPYLCTRVACASPQMWKSACSAVDASSSSVQLVALVAAKTQQHHAYNKCSNTYPKRANAAVTLALTPAFAGAALQLFHVAMNSWVRRCAVQGSPALTVIPRPNNVRQQRSLHHKSHRYLPSSAQVHHLSP